MNQGSPPLSLRPKPLRRVRQLLTLDRQDIAVIVIYGVALGLLSLAVPIAVQSLVNTVAFGSLLQPLVVLTLLLAVALTGAAILRALQVRVAEMLQRRLFVRIVTEIGARLPRVSPQALREANGPELLNRFFDVFTTQKTVASLLLGGVDAVLIALVGLIVLAFYHPALLAFDLVLIAGAVFVLIPLGRGGTRTSIAESQAKYAVVGWLEEVARHPLSFKLAGGDALARSRVELLAKSYLDERDRHFKIVFRQVIGALAIEVVASVALLALGGLLVIERELSIGQLVAAELIVTAVVASIAKLGGKVEIFYDLVAAVDKLGEVLDLPVERTDGETPAASSSAVQGLRLDAVSIDGGPRLDLKVAAGEHVSIDCRSDHVTTALVDALFGMRPPSNGVIEVDGFDLRDLTLAEVRRRVALVRDAEVFPGCILDNLRAGNAELSFEGAWMALRRVGLEETVKALPGGLQTPLARDGSPLSAAETVALTLARGVAARPSVLVIDRLLDRIDPHDADHLAKHLLSERDSALIVVTSSRVMQARLDRHVSLSEPAVSPGEAA